MVSLRTISAALLCTVFCAAPAIGQGVYCSPVFHRPLGQAPDTMNSPRYYIPNIHGAVYGPSYFLRPCFPPEQGFGPGTFKKTVPALTYGQPHPYIPVPVNHPLYPQYFQRAQQQLAYERARAQPLQYGQPHPYIPVPVNHPYYPYYFQQAQQQLAQQQLAQGPAGIAGLPAIHTLPHLPGKEPPPVTFPTHQFVRSPRDFFMWGEAVEDEESRLRHPTLIP